MVVLKTIAKTLTEETLIETHNHVTKAGLMVKGIRDIGTLFWIIGRLRRDSASIPDSISVIARLIKNIMTTHPFWDGNKRTGFAAADVLLRSIGYKIDAKPLEVEKFTMDIDRLKLSETEIYKWLKEHIVKLE